jgi:hypothetical protein
VAVSRVEIWKIYIIDDLFNVSSLLALFRDLISMSVWTGEF